MRVYNFTPEEPLTCIVPPHRDWVGISDVGADRVKPMSLEKHQTRFLTKSIIINNEIGGKTNINQERRTEKALLGTNNF